jgi:PAS domain S-box-containing protein
MTGPSDRDDAPSRLLADAIPHIVWTQDEQGNATYFNRRWVEYTGLGLEETLKAGGASFVHPDDREELQRLFRASRERGEQVEAWYRLRRHDGEYRWHRARVVPLEQSGDRVTTWVGTATDADGERRLWDHQRFLAEASRVLGTSLDVSQTLADVAKLVVPKLADWCAIDLLTKDGGIERPAVAHVDPTKVALAWELWKRTPPRPDDAHGVYAVIRTRQPEHLEEISEELIEQTVTDPEILAIVRGLGLRSSMCVPLVARDHVLGALTFVSAESKRLYGKRDLELAQELAVRISVAVDNARLYTEAMQARTAAEALTAGLIEQSKSVEAALLSMRKERDDALSRLPK